jgi:hypothetical protein
VDSNKPTARLAGLLYLLSSIPGAFAFIYVPGRLVVEGDAAATADRIRGHAGLLRAGIGAELIGMTLFVFVALVLFRLFRPVSEGHAVTMLVLILLSIPITLVGIVHEVAALLLAGGGGGGAYLSALDGRQRDALAYLALQLHVQTIYVAMIFWGLWLFPFGVCVIRSRFIPRILGVLLMLAGAGNVADSITRLALPEYAEAVGRVTRFMTPAELLIILWLLIFGARLGPLAVRSADRGNERGSR